MFEDYKEKLMNNLSGLRQENGTFRASWSDEYNFTWVRDNFWNNLSYLNNDFDKYVQTCQTHLDFLKMYENDYDHKISWLIKDTHVDYKNQSRFIHPKINFDGTEVEGLKWNFMQLDTLPYYINMMYFSWKRSNGKQPFRDYEDRKMIQLLVKVIEKMDICNVNFGSAWEEENEVFLSNISLCMLALENAYEMGFDVNREELRKIRRKVYGMIPYERTGREWDLTMLFPCVLGVFKPIDIEDIVNGVTRELSTKLGVKRYKGDIYKPFDKNLHCNDSKQPCKEEMSWIMGFGYLSYINSKYGNREIAKQYIENIITRFPDGNIPEGVNEKDIPCVNSPLAWSISSLIISIDAYNHTYIN